MSASREKKQRTSNGASKTQKETKEAKAAQSAKRKNIIYGVVGAVLAVLVIALLVWDSGFFQKRAAAATVGGQTLSLAEMQYYYGSARVNQYYQEAYMQQMYAQFGGSYAPTYNLGSKDSEQVRDASTGETWSQYFKTAALNQAQQTVALVSAAKAEGKTLSAEGKASVEEQIKALKNDIANSSSFNGFASYLKVYYGPYLDEGTFRKCMLDEALANEYLTAKQDSLTYSDEELKAYADENAITLYSYDYRYYSFSGAPEAKEDADGNAVEPTEEETAAAKDAAKAKADALTAALNAATGDKAAAFDEALKEIVGTTGDSDTAPTATARANALGSELTGNAYYGWLVASERKNGDVSGPVESGSNYYVVLFEKRGLDESATENVRHVLIKAETPVDDPNTADVNESQGAPTQEALAAAKAKAQSILDEYNSGAKTEDSFAALAEKYSVDTGSNTNGGLYTNVEQGKMVAGFNDWIFDASRNTGDTGIVENIDGTAGSYYGYHVMYYVGQGQLKWQIASETAKKDVDMAAWMDTLKAPHPFEPLAPMASLGA